MESRPFGTCFFEQYAQITLQAILGDDFATLVNRDRPDLQSPDGRSLGIEVTRAMEQSREAEKALLQDISGLTPAGGGSDDELEAILESGYAYGLRGGRFIGARELHYWSMALPMRRILESKVHKAGSGFYGLFDKMGLFVFSREDLSEADAVRAMDYTISLQKYQDIRYNRLYIADVNDLFVCNLDDSIGAGYRLSRYPITREQRKAFFHEAIQKQQSTTE